MIMRRLFASVFALALLAAACGDEADLGTAADSTTTSAAPAPTATPAQPTGSDVERAAVDPTVDVAALAAGINDAGFELLRSLPRDENVVLGPASIGHALLMAQGAADEPTRAAIDAAFGFGPGAHDAWNALDQTITASQSEQVVVSIADRIWPRSDVQPDPGWIDLLASRHGADVAPLDFAGDADASRDTINEWVGDRTEGLIPELLPQGFITPQTVLVLTNAMYFEADWEVPFGKHGTITTDFIGLDGTPVPVELMVELELGDRRGVGDGFVGAEVPYAGGDYSMLVIVPDEGRFADVVERLDQRLLDEIDATFTTGPFELQLPRWETSTTVDLLAHLSGIGAAPGAYPAIARGATLEAAVHAADIAVDETGTVAAAATAFGFDLSGPPEPELVVAADQPFLYLIRHRDSGLVLFAGQVLDPTS